MPVHNAVGGHRRVRKSVAVAAVEPAQRLTPTAASTTWMSNVTLPGMIRFNSGDVATTGAPII